MNTNTYDTSAHKQDKIIYHQQNKTDIEFQNMSVICSIYMFHNLPPNNCHYKNTYGVRGLLQHLYLRFDPKLGQGQCATRCIPCICYACIEKFELPWIYNSVL